MNTSPKRRMSISAVMDRLGTAGDPYGFAVDIETGEEVYLPPALVAKHEMTRDDVGEIFLGFARKQPNDDHLLLTALVEWENEEEDEDEIAAESEALLRLREENASLKAQLKASRSVIGQKAAEEAANTLSGVIERQNSMIKLLEAHRASLEGVVEKLTKG